MSVTTPNSDDNDDIDEELNVSVESSTQKKKKDSDSESDCDGMTERVKSNRDLILDKKCLKENVKILLSRLLANKLDQYPNSDEDVAEGHRKRTANLTSATRYDSNLPLREKIKKRKLAIAVPTLSV
ncbi:unnamed protein product, partial [Allacma fusca]